MYLSPESRWRKWSLEEDNLLRECVLIYGQKWSVVAQRFYCRSSLDLKNRYMRLMRDSMKTQACRPVGATKTDLLSTLNLPESLPESFPDDLLGSSASYLEWFMALQNDGDVAAKSISDLIWLAPSDASVTTLANGTTGLYDE
jgi:hypothetical protein